MWEYLVSLSISGKFYHAGFLIVLIGLISMFIGATVNLINNFKA